MTGYFLTGSPNEWIDEYTKDWSIEEVMQHVQHCGDTQERCSNNSSTAFNHGKINEFWLNIYTLIGAAAICERLVSTRHCEHGMIIQDCAICFKTETIRYDGA